MGESREELAVGNSSTSCQQTLLLAIPVSIRMMGEFSETLEFVFEEC